MEEKPEGTPNPLTSGPEEERFEGEQEQPNTSSPEDGAETKQEDEAFVPPVELMGTAEEETDEQATEDAETNEEAAAEVDAEAPAEPFKEKTTKIKVVEVEEEPQAAEQKQSQDEQAKSQDERVAEPTSEENAYQPPQETGAPAPVIDMVKPARPKEMLEESLAIEEDYIADPSIEETAMGMAAESFDSSQASLDPTNRPMEHVPTVMPVPVRKPKRTGLIIGLVVSLFVAVGCGVAAALIFMHGEKVDPVATAMSRAINGQSPKNVAIDGEVEIKVEDQTSPISDLEIALKGEVAINSMTNNLSATLTANYRDGSDSALYTLDEVYISGGDLYFRIDGIGEAASETVAEVEAAETTEATEVTEVTEGAEATEEVEVVEEADPSLALLEIFGTINGEWIRVPMDNVNSLLGSGTSGDGLSCLPDLVAGIRSNSNTIAGIYNKYPFVAAADNKQVGLASNENPVYQVAWNTENLTSFMKEAQSSVLSDWMSCINNRSAYTSAYSDIAVPAAKETSLEAADLPEVYVEVDDEYNFTRLYFTTEAWGEEAEASVTADLNFSYPTSINAPEPQEYRDLSDVLQEIFSGMFIAESTEENSIDGSDGGES